MRLGQSASACVLAGLHGMHTNNMIANAKKAHACDRWQAVGIAQKVAGLTC